MRLPFRLFPSPSRESSLPPQSSFLTASGTVAMEKLSKEWSKPISHTSKHFLGRHFLVMPYWESGPASGNSFLDTKNKSARARTRRLFMLSAWGKSCPYFRIRHPLGVAPPTTRCKKTVSSTHRRECRCCSSMNAALFPQSR